MKSFQLNAALLFCLTAPSILFASGCTVEAGENVGQLTSTLVMGNVQHDVDSIHYKVVSATDDCSADAIDETTVPIEAETLSLSLQPAGAGDNHPFGDALFVLAPGEYRVCATPMNGENPSSECAPVDEVATVTASETKEILLISQCGGEGRGGLDVITAFNDPPLIDLELDPSKFIFACETLTITADVTDPNGDAIETYSWAQISGPADGELSPDGPVLEFSTSTPGDYEVELTVVDVYGGTSSLSFPIHVSAGEDLDGNGIPDTCDCLAEPAFNWVTWDMSTETANTVSGVIGDVGVTYESSSPLIFSSALVFYGVFPESFGIPRGPDVIRNETMTTNRVIFDEPVQDPVLVFSSVGRPNQSVTVDFGGTPIEVEFQSAINGGRASSTPTSITGAEGFFVVRVPGEHSEVRFTYDTAEVYANFVFGAVSQPDECIPSP